MQFDFSDIILSIGVVQALFLSLMLTRVKGQSKSINRALIQILLVMAFVLTGRIILKHEIAWSFFRWLAFTDSIIFIFGLLNYTYVRRLLVKSEVSYRPSWKHYILLIVCSGIFLSLNFLTPEYYRLLQGQGYLYWLFNGFELMGLLSNLVYLIISFNILRNFKRRFKQQQSIRQNLSRLMLCYLTAIGIYFLFWTISYVNKYYFTLPIAYISYDGIWITIPFFIYAMAYFSLLKPELFRINEEVSTDSIRSKRLTSAEVDSLKSGLARLMNEEQVYMQNDLTLRELALMLSTSANNVSWLLNNEYGTSFYDFINQHRIAEFLKRVHGPVRRDQTILGLAMEVGFNSKSTFNKVFKAQKSVTPSEYIKNIKTLSEMA